MYPIGTYDRFVQKIKGREGKGKPKYLGVLFCDIEQQNVKEYIINYIKVFDKNSAEYFDFYIPGYLESKTSYTSDMFEFKGDKYKFNREKYNEFCYKFSQDFEIEFPYVATLVLLEYESGNFNMAKRSVFNLEEIQGNLKSSGCFFDLIFKSAEGNNDLQSILDDIYKQNNENLKWLFTVINQITSFFNVDLKDIKDRFVECKKNQKQYKLK